MTNQNIQINRHGPKKNSYDQASLHVNHVWPTVLILCQCDIYIHVHTPNKISNWSPYIFKLVKKVKTSYTRFMLL